MLSSLYLFKKQEEEKEQKRSRYKLRLFCLQLIQKRKKERNQKGSRQKPRLFCLQLIQKRKKETMHASVDEQPKHAGSNVKMPHQQQQGGHPSTWSTGLWGCSEDCSSCCLTCWCPCITFGQIAEIADSGSTSCGVSGALYALLHYFTGCACCYSCFYRNKLRAKFNLEEEPCGDCLVHCFCECCALSQEYRELKNRGFDPSLGWVGNQEKQDQAASQRRFATAPPMGQAMNK